MTTQINGSTGVNLIQDGTIVQADLSVNVAGNGPAFSAYANSASSIPNGSWGKVSLQLENYDTNNSFDSTTNYRFQPNVPGYYQVSGAVINIASATGLSGVAIFKNTSTAILKNSVPNTTSGGAVSISGLVFLNGSSDYVELFAFQNTGAPANTTGTSDTTFQGFLARSA